MKYNNKKLTHTTIFLLMSSVFTGAAFAGSSYVMRGVVKGMKPGSSSSSSPIQNPAPGVSSSSAQANASSSAPISSAASSTEQASSSAASSVAPAEWVNSGAPTCDPWTPAIVDASIVTNFLQSQVCHQLQVQTKEDGSLIYQTIDEEKSRNVDYSLTLLSSALTNTNGQANIQLAKFTPTNFALISIFDGSGWVSGTKVTHTAPALEKNSNKIQYKSDGAVIFETITMTSVATTVNYTSTLGSKISAFIDSANDCSSDPSGVLGMTFSQISNYYNTHGESSQISENCVGTGYASYSLNLEKTDSRLNIPIFGGSNTFTSATSRAISAPVQKTFYYYIGHHSSQLPVANGCVADINNDYLSNPYAAFGSASHSIQVGASCREVTRESYSVIQSATYSTSDGSVSINPSLNTSQQSNVISNDSPEFTVQKTMPYAITVSQIGFRDNGGCSYPNYTFETYTNAQYAAFLTNNRVSDPSDTVIVAEANDAIMHCSGNMLYSYSFTVNNQDFEPRAPVSGLGPLIYQDTTSMVRVTYNKVTHELNASDNFGYLSIIKTANLGL